MACEKQKEGAELNRFFGESGSVELPKGIEIESYIGEDGVPVVHVNTPGLPDGEGGPVMRLYMNDALATGFDESW